MRRSSLRLCLLASALFPAAAHADPLVLDFQGATFVHFAGTPEGPPVANGTSFDVRAAFDTATGSPLGQGIVDYAVTSVVLTGGGASYTVTDPGDYSVILVDATNTAIPGFYLPLLDNNSPDVQFNELGPAYSTATPAFDAAAPTPTVFSGYTESQTQGNILELSTAAGPVTLEIPFGTGMGASISAVPEPSPLGLCGVAGSVALAVARLRRKRAA